MSFSEDSGCFDISKEEPKPMTNGLCPETNGPYMQMAGLDLSVVKKEEDGGAGAKTLKTDKGTKNRAAAIYCDTQILGYGH